MITFQRASRDYCDYCHQSFPKRAYQIYVKRKGSWNRVFHHHYHIKCYGESAQRSRYQCLHDLISDDRLAKVDDVTRRDILSVYPMVLWPLERRAVVKLPKAIEKLTVKELKLELVKRDVARPSNKRKKQDLVDLLNEFFGLGYVKEFRTRYTAMGYCRRMEGQQYRMNIPEYLKQIVVNYCAFRRRRSSG